jgi:hypothetical protein
VGAGGKLFFTAGNIESDFVEVYDTLDGTWSRLQLSEPRALITVVASGSTVIFASGLTGGGSSDHVDVYDAVQGTLELTHFPLGGRSTNGIAVDNNAFFAGGDALAIYNIEQRTWKMKGLSEYKFLMALGTANHKVMLFGGWRYKFDDFSTTIEIYDPSTESWEYQAMQLGLFGEATVSFDNAIYSAGGSINDGANDVSGIFKLTF